MNAAPDMGDPAPIHVWVERADPLAGTAAVDGAEALSFQGWLELLRVLPGLVVDDRREESMRIGLTGIFVDDQDRAERFYTEVLGLQVKTSAAYGPGERWLTVVSPEEPDGVALVLHLADDPARMPYGGMDAVFDDTSGNLVNLHQD
jgi:Glyoxalase/Bleomycin resistance protein/Dioxygenase superfamily